MQCSASPRAAGYGCTCSMALLLLWTPLSHVMSHQAVSSTSKVLDACTALPGLLPTEDTRKFTKRGSYHTKPSSHLKTRSAASVKGMTWSSLSETPSGTDMMLRFTLKYPPTITLNLTAPLTGSRTAS